MKTTLFLKFFLLISVFQVCETEAQDQIQDSKNVQFFLRADTFAISYNLNTKQANVVKNVLSVEPGAVMKSHSFPIKSPYSPNLVSYISSICTPNEHVYIFPIGLDVKEFFYNLTQENVLTEVKSTLIESDGEFEAVVEKMTDFFMEILSYSGLAELYCAVCAQNYLGKSAFCLALGSRIEAFLRIKLLSYKDILQMQPLWNPVSVSSHEKAVEFIEKLATCGNVWPGHEVAQFKPAFDLARDIIAKYWAEESKIFFDTNFNNKAERKKAAEELSNRLFNSKWTLERSAQKDLHFFFSQDIKTFLDKVLDPLYSKLIAIKYSSDLDPVDQLHLIGICLGSCALAMGFMICMIKLDDMASGRRR